MEYRQHDPQHVPPQPQASAPSPVPEMVRNRLPTLFEVLSRRTHPPVDLFSFYIYMRDQQRSVDYLDFWLDVAQHMSLCRHYVRELRRSVLVSTPEMDKSGSKRSSVALDAMAGGNNNNTNPRDAMAGPSSSHQTEKDREESAQMSAFLRDSPNLLPVNPPQHQQHSSPASSLDRSRNTPKMSTSDSHSPAHAVNRDDIRASAENILYTFLLPGAEREIALTDAITNDIIQSIEQDGRDDPEVFDVAKDYVFQAMERDAFPGFLRARALGNLIPPTIIARLVIGLISIFAGFWTSFVLIFLNFSRTTRCWVILPFTLGVYLLASYQYSLDPVMGLLGFSEYTSFNFSRIREPYVRKLIVKRSLMVLAVTVIIDAAICVLFVLVPGKRL